MNQEYKKILQAINEINRALPVMVSEMGNIALNQTLKTFRDQGYTDETLVKWASRKRNDKKAGRGILIGQGSGTTGLRGSYRKVRRSALSISIVNDKVYSGVHNEGLMAGRGRGFKMKERRMIGDSAIMRRLIGKSIGNRIGKIFTQ
jgi:phage gpG-like protein